MMTEKKAAIPSLPSRLLQVFFSPGELFSALRGNPAWFGALAVGAVVVLISMLLIPGDLWTQFAREQAIQAGAEAPPAAATAVIRIFAILGGGLGFFIWAFIMAGIVTLFFKVFFGDDGSYRQYLSVVSHALIIGGVGSLLLTPLRIIQENPQLTLNMGTFFSFLEEGYVMRVLRMLELFGLWAMVVMAIGVSKIDPRRSFGSALTFFVILTVGMAMIFGIFPSQV